MGRKDSRHLPPDRPSAIQRLTEQLGERFVGHLVRPALVGGMEDPDGRGVAASDCGHDRIEVLVRVREGRVAEARFLATGCAHALACASAAATCLLGHSVADARRRTTADRVSDELGGLDDAHRHCADLAVRAARAAMDDALRTVREPWRRVYRR